MVADPDCTRDQLSRVGTLFLWTCPNQANAIVYPADIYLYEFTLGITHPDNAADAMCLAGQVCHEDDIEVVFGTFSSASASQSALSAEVQSRWTSFAANGNPNVQGKPQWNPVSSSSHLNVLRLGATDVVNQTLYGDICGPIFGSSVPFNYQLFD
jgi:carboxylesterase type B